MGGKKKIYEALLEGARQGLADRALYDHVVEQCEKASSKKIVRASLLALSDSDVKDAKVLETIYALAIKHRLDPVSAHDVEDESDERPSRDTRKGGKKKSAGKGERLDVLAEATENDA